MSKVAFLPTRDWKEVRVTVFIWSKALESSSVTLLNDRELLQVGLDPYLTAPDFVEMQRSPHGFCYRQGYLVG